MALIPEDELQQLKSDIAVADLVRQSGITLKKHGKDLIGHCPFHDDKTPSLVISTDKNLWHCMGKCQMGGSTIDWVMKTQGVNFRHAADILRNKVPLKVGVFKKSSTRHLPCPIDLEADEQQALNESITYYHETLLKSKAALEYLTKRGLMNTEMINHFKLGFSDRSLGLRLPVKHRTDGKVIRAKLQNKGILRSSGHEHFAGSITFPIIDEQGNTTEVYGRKINNGLRKGTAFHIYLPGPHLGIFNQSELINCETIILTESIIDCLSLWIHGFKNTTTSYGIEGFTNELFQFLQTNGTKEILIAYDNDEAGNTAATKLAAKLNGEGIECKRINLPLHTDINELICKADNPKQALTEAIVQSQRIGDTLHEETKEIASPSLVAPEDTHPPSKAWQLKGEAYLIKLGDRHYRVLGLNKNRTLDTLKVNVKINAGDLFHIDTLDMYLSKARLSYTKQAAIELGINPEIIKEDLCKVLNILEEIEEELLNEDITSREEKIELSEKDKKEALSYLTDPDLMKHLLRDLNSVGLVGEEMNKVMAYLCGVSRQLDRPLGVIVQSTSAAGKSSLMDGVLKFMPEEEVIRFSSMSGQSLFYMGETNLKHKILAIAEEEGAKKASYSLKILQSDGELTMASAGKDPKSGKIQTMEYKVEGPCQIFMTTTSIDVDPELQNRCLVLTVDESSNQTRAIHKLQRFNETLEGIVAKEAQKAIYTKHHNIQRMIRPIKVVNPYAMELSFFDGKTRTRRDHQKYLDLIKTVTLFHQYQREIKAHKNPDFEYIEVSLKDIEIANELARELLGVSLDDLPPQTRNLLNIITEYVEKATKEKDTEQHAFFFSRREVREYCGWTEFQVRTHMNRLCELEYIISHKGQKGQTFKYELVYTKDQGIDGSSFILGLIEPKANTSKVEENNTTITTSRGVKGNFEPPMSPPSAQGVHGVNHHIAYAT